MSTRDVRYLVALINSKPQTIEGVILSSGEQLGNVFTYVSDKSYKCQRTIPMAFFEQFSGDCVFNPLLNTTLTNAFSISITVWLSGLLFSLMMSLTSCIIFWELVNFGSGIGYFVTYCARYLLRPLYSLLLKHRS